MPVQRLDETTRNETCRRTLAAVQEEVGEVID